MAIRGMACMGLGSPTAGYKIDEAAYSRSLIQHAKAIDLALQAKREHHLRNSEHDFHLRFQDPEYTDEDRDLLEELGVEVFASEKAVQQHISRTVMFYEQSSSGSMPCQILEGQVAVLVTTMVTVQEKFDFMWEGTDLNDHYVEIFHIEEKEEPEPERAVPHAVDGTRGFVRKDSRT